MRVSENQLSAIGELQSQEVSLRRFRAKQTKAFQVAVSTQGWYGILANAISGKSKIQCFGQLWKQDATVFRAKEKDFRYI
jgi:hypothetical protein